VTIGLDSSLVRIQEAWYFGLVTLVVLLEHSNYTSSAVAKSTRRTYGEIKLPCVPFTVDSTVGVSSKDPVDECDCLPGKLVWVRVVMGMGDKYQ